MKQSRNILLIALSLCLLKTTCPNLRAETLHANGVISGSIFNTATRQHIQASFTGSGVVKPSGDHGRANGRVTSVIGDRTPRATLAGPYRVLVQAHVSYDGGSTSVTRTVTVTVYRNLVVIPGLGRIPLDRPINLTREGRQTFRAAGSFTVPVP